jgi:hypothetical protein
VSALLVKDFMQDIPRDQGPSRPFNVISIHLNSLGSESEGKEADSMSPVSIPSASPVSHDEEQARLLSRSAPSGNTEELIRKFSWV